MMSDLCVNLADDIYYQNDYSSLYALNGEEVFNFEYVQNSNRILFRSIKRRIKDVAGSIIDEELYDLETPYGYGGPITNCYSEQFLDDAFLAYREECIKQKIICEFIRFHPFNKLAQYKDYFDFYAQERKVVIVDLTLNTEDRWSKYSKTTRNILRKANKNLSRNKDEDSLVRFCSLYQQTMDKNDASDFYYFKPNYFEKLKDVKGVELLSVKNELAVVSSGFFMHGSDIAHYHLSANNSEFNRENGNYALLDFAFDYAKEQGCKWMMLGGGRTSDENDSLFKFKSKFSDKSLPFFIGGLTFLPEKRAELNSMWQQENPDSQLKLFQLYRNS